MYLGMIVAFVVVLPIASIVIEWLTRPRHRDLLLLAGRWFVFWAVGVRLFTAGLSQAFQPDYTARDIFDIADPVVLPFIQELGFANLAIGAIAIASVFARRWITPAAVGGAVFLGLAGLRHLFVGDTGTFAEVVALVSDLFIFLVLMVYLVLRATQTSSASRSTPTVQPQDAPATPQP